LSGSFEVRMESKNLLLHNQKKTKKLACAVGGRGNVGEDVVTLRLQSPKTLLPGKRSTSVFLHQKFDQV
jgi:hypothetical protein